MLAMGHLNFLPGKLRFAGIGCGQSGTSPGAGAAQPPVAPWVPPCLSALVASYTDAKDVLQRLPCSTLRCGRAGASVRPGGLTLALCRLPSSLSAASAASQAGGDRRVGWAALSQARWQECCLLWLLVPPRSQPGTRPSCDSEKYWQLESTAPGPAELHIFKSSLSPK